MKSIREQVSTILGIINVRFKELNGGECAEFANALASILPNLLDKEAELEGVANMYKVMLMQDEEKPKSGVEAEAMMKGSQEWLDWRKVRALRVGTEETIRTLKRRIDIKLHEEREFTS